MKTEFGSIFKEASMRMKEKGAGEAWSEALKNSKTDMKEEDIKILETLGKLLGKTNASRTT